MGGRQGVVVDDTIGAHREALVSLVLAFLRVPNCRAQSEGKPGYDRTKMAI